MTRLDLDLTSAYQLALNRNLNLQVGRYTIAAANSNIFANTGIFDPNFTAGVIGDFTRAPSASILEGAFVDESRNTRLGVGVNQLLPTGTYLELQTGGLRRGTNSPIYYFNPSYNADLALTLRQPLLDGFGTSSTAPGSSSPRSAASGPRPGSSRQLSPPSATSRTPTGISSPRAAPSRSANSRSTLAQQLLNETQERVKVGTSAPIDTVQSEATVATRVQDLIYARNLAANAEDQLKAVLGFDDPREWMVTITTTEEYGYTPIEPDLREAIETAHRLAARNPREAPRDRPTRLQHQESPST